MLQQIRGALIGLAVGDALGVPVEFRTREYLTQNPVTTLIGYGSWQQPSGTWSDDSSLSFCLAESLTKGYQLDDIANNFTLWLQQGFWGAHYEIFDVGGATRHAIKRLMNGCSPSLSGGMQEKDNGNGSLMRIMPLLFYIEPFEIDKRYEFVKEVSAITHAHFRSVFSCFILLEFALNILHGASATEAYNKMKTDVKLFATDNNFNTDEIVFFTRILDNNIKDFDIGMIQSNGYVIDTLESSLWCLLHTSNYKEAVLKAVNLGGDTDTTACVTGGLAGLLYGIDTIPVEWIKALARINDIENLCNRFSKTISI